MSGSPAIHPNYSTSNDPHYQQQQYSHSPQMISPANVVQMHSDDEQMYKRRCRALKSIVYELEDENNLIAYKINRLKDDLEKRKQELERRQAEEDAKWERQRAQAIEMQQSQRTHHTNTSQTNSVSPTKMDTEVDGDIDMAMTNHNAERGGGHREDHPALYEYERERERENNRDRDRREQGRSSPIEQGSRMDRSSLSRLPETSPPGSRGTSMRGGEEGEGEDEIMDDY